MEAFLGLFDKLMDNHYEKAMDNLKNHRTFLLNAVLLNFHNLPIVIVSMNISFFEADHQLIVENHLTSLCEIYLSS